MGHGYYVLDAEGNPKAEPDVLVWARWYEDRNNRHIALSKVGDSEISTVFLGLDHNFGMGVPILYETMVFGGKLGDEQERYATREEAIEGHRRMVERVRGEG